MRADLQAIGYQTSVPRRIAASTTRFYTGEPLHSVATYSSGAANTNVFVPAAADTPVIGTHRFGGIVNGKDPLPQPTGTLVAQTTKAACPIPNIGKIRGKGEVYANVDTDAEILLIIGDLVLIDYNSTGGVGSTPLYTIKDTASANTSGLEIAEGNAALGTLDVYVHATAYRSVVS